MSWFCCLNYQRLGRRSRRRSFPTSQRWLKFLLPPKFFFSSGWRIDQKSRIGYHKAAVRVTSRYLDGCRLGHFHSTYSDLQGISCCPLHHCCTEDFIWWDCLAPLEFTKLDRLDHLPFHSFLLRLPCISELFLDLRWRGLFVVCKRRPSRADRTKFRQRRLHTGLPHRSCPDLSASPRSTTWCWLPPVMCSCRQHSPCSGSWGRFQPTGSEALLRCNSQILSY